MLENLSNKQKLGGQKKLFRQISFLSQIIAFEGVDCNQ
jgi:hypothetical protein